MEIDKLSIAFELNEYGNIIIEYIQKSDTKMRLLYDKAIEIDLSN